VSAAFLRTHFEFKGVPGVNAIKVGVFGGPGCEGIWPHDGIDGVELVGHELLKQLADDLRVDSQRPERPSANACVPERVP